MKIIFLDIDGVLNDNEYFQKSEVIRKMNTLGIVENSLLEIDYDKLYLLKELINATDAKVIIISSWAKLSWYSLIQDKLINLGIPIIDVVNNNIDRVSFIKNYLKEHDIQDYLIIDDEFFLGYEDFYGHLIKTSFDRGGLNEVDIEDAKYLLKRS